jgi:benzodiazapine receptor
MSRRSWTGLGGFVAATAATAIVGGAVTATSVDSWYVTIQKPAWTPPNALFGPVWTTLFIMMAIAGWRVWSRSGPGEARQLLRWFGVQLALNALWSCLFFGLRRPDLALCDILALDLVLVLMFRRFLRVDPVAGWMWAPYVAWVGFATALNGAVYALNR